MNLDRLTDTEGEYRRRLLAAFGVSVTFHTVLLLMIAFDVLGPGFGLGIGTGPGVGIGAGGGPGTGDKGRQIFALSEAQIEAQRPTSEPYEERLAKLLEPTQPLRPSVAPIARPDVRKLPVLPLTSRRREVALVRNARGRIARMGTGVGGLDLGGGGGGMGFSFGHYVGTLRRKGLDVVIVLDATGSMQNVIDEVKDRMVDLAGTIQKLVPTARVGAVAFRDRPNPDAPASADEDFVVRWSDLTFDGPKVKAFLGRITAGSGGDWEEAVLEGLDTAIVEMSWRRDAKKVIILVGSSPPHADERSAIANMVKRFATTMDGTISTIDVTKRLHEEHERRIHRWLFGTEPAEISPLPDFYRDVQKSYRAIASTGGGDMLTLDTHNTLVRHLLVLTFGTEWKKEVARIARGM